MGRSGRGGHDRGIRSGRCACEPHRDATRDHSCADTYSPGFVRRCRPIAGSGQLHAALGVRSAAAGHVRRLVSAATISFEAIGTTAQLTLADGRQIDEAEALMRMRLHEIDRAASRFRPDSEIALVEAMGGPRRVSALLSGAVHTALAAARDTGGIVDPTTQLGRAGRWREVDLDPHRRLLGIPEDTQIDVGATGKAMMADRIARDAQRVSGSAALVNLGGDIAVAGGAGWHVGVADDHKAAAPQQVVRIESGGVATSSTTVRPGHIIDPETGDPVDSPWRTVTVAGRTCVAANAASTAAIVLGEQAPRWLALRGVAARLVAHDGSVLRVGGWPR